MRKYIKEKWHWITNNILYQKWIKINNCKKF